MNTVFRQTAVATPINEGEKFVWQETWLPKGKWIEFETGDVLEGPAMVKRPFALDEIPLFIKAESILPLSPKIKHADENPLNALVINCYPGADGHFELYEDAGDDSNYKKDAYSFVPMDFSSQSNALKLTIFPRVGKYKGMVKKRGYELRFVNTYPPKSVSVNGKEVPYSTEKYMEERWEYKGKQVALVVYLDERKTSKKIEVDIELADADTQLLSGIKGKIKRLKVLTDHVARPKKKRYVYEPVVDTYLIGSKMTYDPDQAVDLVAGFDTAYEKVLQWLETEQGAPYKNTLPKED